MKNIYEIHDAVTDAYDDGYFDDKDIDEACDELADVLDVDWELVYFCAKSLIVYEHDALFENVEEQVRERFYEGDDDGPLEIEWDGAWYGSTVVRAFFDAFEDDE